MAASWPGPVGSVSSLHQEPLCAGPLAASQGLTAPSPCCCHLSSPQREDGRVTSALRCAAPAQHAVPGRVSSGCGPSSATREAVGAARAADDTFAGSSYHRRPAPPAAGSPGTRAWGQAARRAQPPRYGPAFQPAQHSARATPGDALAAKSPAPRLRTGTRLSPHAATSEAASPASCVLLAPLRVPAGRISVRRGVRKRGGARLIVGARQRPPPVGGARAGLPSDWAGARASGA